MIYDDEHQRESKLPKWTRQLLQQLRLENTSMKERLAQLTNTDVSATNVVEIDYVHGEHALSEDAIIDFRRPKEPGKLPVSFTVYHSNNGIAVSAGRSGMVVKPLTSNLVHIEMEQE